MSYNYHEHICLRLFVQAALADDVIDVEGEVVAGRLTSACQHERHVALVDVLLAELLADSAKLA